VRSRIKLITTGRRSGKDREVELYAFDDGDRLIVVGSQGGSSRDPAWCHNLRANPAARVRRGRTAAPEEPVRAQEALGDERVRLWELVTGVSPFYIGFQRKTRRVIPLFVLEPIGGA
jgi:deazaflavin-dependent oxidoreductase (nitroreductase family)